MKFLRIVRDNYEHFEFVPRNGLDLTRAIRVIISSSAAQLALFLPLESLSYYEKIIVYPDYYTSLITGLQHKGEVNPGLRIIVLSWRGIVEGLERPDDGINLLLHEFAHALWLENKLMNDQYPVLDSALVHQFETFALEEMTKPGDIGQHFFRKYAFQNIEEFFAVAVENFFERPVALNQQLPRLYSILVRLFGQDPGEKIIS